VFFLWQWKVMLESARTGFRKRGKKAIEALNFVGLNCFPGYIFYGFRLLLWSLVRTLLRCLIRRQEENFKACMLLEMFLRVLQLII